MPFESQWARIPLGVRWGVSLLVGALIVAGIVVFVSANNNNSLAHVSAKNAAREARQAAILIGEDQAPRTVAVPGRGLRAAEAALVTGIRRDMRRQIAQGTFDGPLGSVSCVPHGGGPQRVAYHCIAVAAQVRYPFLAVATPARHQAVFCKKDYAPQPGENIPVSARCRL